MARLNLSFFAALLVLAVCAMSLPTKRDEGHSFGLAKALGGLEKIPKFMENLDPQNKNDQQNEADKAPAADNTKKEEDQKADEQKTEKPAAAKEEEKVAKDDTPTATEKKPYSGNFATPTATHTHHPSSKANALGAIPIVGGLLGGTGGSL